MALTKKPDCRNSAYQKVSFDLKLSIIDQIINGQISVNHAAKVYNRSAFRISRSSITYWMQKAERRPLRTFKQKSKGMSKNDEIKKLRERIEALEFIKEIQQDIIVELEVCTGEDFSKKLLPESLTKEIQKKKQTLIK